MNATYTKIAAAALVTLAFSAVAQAAGPVVLTGHGHAYRNGYYARHYRAVTPAESYLRGASYVIRAQGEYNLNTSAAMINGEEARSRYYDNEIKRVDTYFEKRRVNKSNRAAERRARMSAADLATLNDHRQPKRLSTLNFDPVLGIIQWPAALQGDEFAAGRTIVETSFAVGRPGERGDVSKIKRATNQMLSILKTKVRTIESSEYMEARNFLTGVSLESLAPRDVQQIAAIR